MNLDVLLSCIKYTGCGIGFRYRRIGVDCRKLHKVHTLLISGRDPPTYFKLSLIAMWVHQNQNAVSIPVAVLVLNMFYHRGKSKYYRGLGVKSVVVVVVDSHIQRIVLATEETTVTQVSHLSNANPACGHKEVRRSTGHIMVTTRYSDQ